jgi:transcriptional regulator GlxA family with amidase domain
MSRRNFTRHFRQATGTSFKQWILSQRLAQAQRMLESTDASIEVVAQQAGFGTSLSLRKHFQAALRISPSAYRRQFRANPSAAASSSCMAAVRTSPALWDKAAPSPCVFPLPS